jgi:hypothetical protein
LITFNSFIAGADKWHVENLIDCDFLWHAHPFENSGSKGFLLPETEIKKPIDIPVIIDVSEVSKININSINMEKTIFYSEIWSSQCSIFATIARNIVVFKNGVPIKIKENYKMI